MYKCQVLVYSIDLSVKKMEKNMIETEYKQVLLASYSMPSFLLNFAKLLAIFHGVQ